MPVKRKRHTSNGKTWIFQHILGKFRNIHLVPNLLNYLENHEMYGAEIVQFV
jgi:hypothetical protein